ncbi:Uncharacterized protein FWK35_00036462 [Aphis craccivora]|uniref:Uncharacterized protein n=1 Tax=Aphis craccivora TaxID=307492 RepID=A0A6G0VTC4_APHCR|nr:Uncharacterized protein FWK35_00036462 [Aphis craccivora]
MVLEIDPHESAKRYVSSRRHHIRVILLSIRDRFWQPFKSLINPADRESRGIMPIVPVRTIVYWCGTHGVNGNPSEWDDSFPPIFSCDLKYLFSRITCIVDIMTNKLSTRTRNCDHTLHTVVYMRRRTAVRGRNCCDPSVRVTVRGAWVLYIPPSNLFPHVVFDGGGRSRRSVRSNRERAMSIASMSCVSQYLGRRLHQLLFLANTANTFIRTSTHSVMAGFAVGRLSMCVMRLIIVLRNVKSGVCPHLYYYPPIT